MVTGSWRLGGLAAWMLMAMVMRILMNDHKEKGWKKFSHARALRSSADTIKTGS